MGAAVATPLPSATSLMPKAEVEDLKYFGHSPAKPTGDHSWMYEVVAQAILTSSRSGKIATFFSKAVAAGIFADAMFSPA